MTSDSSVPPSSTRYLRIASRTSFCSQLSSRNAIAFCRDRNSRYFESLPPELPAMVGQHGILFVVNLIKDHFEDIVFKVCCCLLRRVSLTLQEIVKDTEMTTSQVKNCLLVLIQHNCVQAYSVPRPAAIGVTPKVITMYMALFENIIHRLCFVKFMKIVADDLGPQCEALLEGLLQHGDLHLSSLWNVHYQEKGVLVIEIPSLQALINLF